MLLVGQEWLSSKAQSWSSINQNFSFCIILIESLLKESPRNWELKFLHFRKHQQLLILTVLTCFVGKGRSWERPCKQSFGFHVGSVLIITCQGGQVSQLRRCDTPKMDLLSIGKSKLFGEAELQQHHCGDGEEQGQSQCQEQHGDQQKNSLLVADFCCPRLR